MTAPDRSPAAGPEGGRTTLLDRLATLLKRAEQQITEHHSSHHVTAFAEPGTSICPACAEMAKRHGDTVGWAFFEDVRKALTEYRSALSQPAGEAGGETEPTCGRRIIRGGYFRGICALPFGHDSANNPNASPCRPAVAGAAREDAPDA